MLASVQHIFHDILTLLSPLISSPSMKGDLLRKAGVTFVEIRLTQGLSPCTVVSHINRVRSTEVGSPFHEGLVISPLLKPFIGGVSVNLGLFIGYSMGSV